MPSQHMIINLLVAFVHPVWQIKESNYTRLCKERTVLTVNGQFPGPTIYARKGDLVIVNVYNQGDKNITIHW